MDTNRAAAKLLAVEDHVVVKSASLERRGFKQREIVGIRCRERMVYRNQALVVGAVLEQRKIDDPQELELVGFVEPEFRGELQTDVTEDRAPFVGPASAHP